MTKRKLVRTLVGTFLFVGFLVLMNRITTYETEEQKFERLIGALQSQNMEDDLGSTRTRSRAARDLGDMGEDAVPVLIQALQNDPNQYVRTSVVFALADIGRSTKNTKNITFALIQALQNDPHEDVRNCVALILGERQEYMMGENAKDVVPALIQVLKHDQDGEVRACVAGALDDIGENAKDAVPALIQVLQHDQDSEFRAYVAGALVKIGTAEAIKAAKGAIPDLIGLLQHEYEPYRSSAANALSKIGTPEALKGLEGSNHER